MRSEQFNPLRIRLSKDVIYFKGRLKCRDDQGVMLRSYVRAVFAFFEGYLYAFKQISLRLSVDPEGIKLSPEEIIALKEIDVSVDDKGNIKERPKYNSAKNSVLFSIASIAKQHEAEFTLNTGGQGWDFYQKALKVRDRLMHPKSHEDLEISEDELTHVTVAYDWFTSELEKLEKKIIAPKRKNA